VHGEPGGRRAVRQVAETGQAGAGRPGGALVDIPQHAEHRAELDQRLLAYVVDGRQGRTGAFGLAVHQVQRGVGLDVDDRDVVRYHVVQVPRHPHPLLAGPSAKLLLTAPLQRGGPLAPDADQLGGAQQEHQPGRQPERERGGGVAALPDQPGPYGCGVADDQRGDRGRPLPGEHRVEEGHDQREIDHVRAFAARPQCRDQDDGKDADRITAAGNQ
jgi:hypothetical protein